MKTFAAIALVTLFFSQAHAHISPYVPGAKGEKIYSVEYHRNDLVSGYMGYNCTIGFLDSARSKAGILQFEAFGSNLPTVTHDFRVVNNSAFQALQNISKKTTVYDEFYPPEGPSYTLFTHDGKYEELKDFGPGKFWMRPSANSKTVALVDALCNDAKSRFNKLHANAAVPR